jgi:hypothetical protein
MAWKSNPDTGESYQVEDATPGAGQETGYQNFSPAPSKPKAVPKFQGNINPAPALPPPAPVPPPVPLPQQPQAPPMPTQNGQVAYNPTTAPYGFDQSAPGVREQFWNNNQDMWFQSPSLDFVDSQMGQFKDPWQGEAFNAGQLGNQGNKAGQDYWAGVSGQYNQMTPNQMSIRAGYHGGNNAQTAFDLTGEHMPGSLQPQFDAYYDRMKQKTMSDVNSQSAARGAYGSNTALNNTIGAGLDVEADRAKAATQFSLDDSANQRNWFDSYSTQGRAADLTSQGAFNLNIDAAKYGDNHMKDMADIAFRSEQAGLDRDKFNSDAAFSLDDHRATRLSNGISTGLASHGAHQGQLNDAFGAAGQAQDSRDARVNNLYSQVSGFSKDVQDFVSENYDKIIGNAANMTDEELQTMIAKTADQRGWDQQTQERNFRDIKAAIDTYIGAQTGKAATVAPALPGPGK